jgi:hypothetical protein
MSALVRIHISNEANAATRAQLEFGLRRNGWRVIAVARPIPERRTYVYTVALGAADSIGDPAVLARWSWPAGRRRLLSLVDRARRSVRPASLPQQPAPSRTTAEKLSGSPAEIAAP